MQVYLVSYFELPFDIVMLYVFNGDYLFIRLNSDYIVSGTCYIALKYILTLKDFEISFINLSFYQLMGVLGQYSADYGGLVRPVRKMSHHMKP